MGVALAGFRRPWPVWSLNVQAAFKSSKRLKSSLHFFNCGGAALSGSLMGAMGCLKKPNNRKLYRLVLAFVL